MRKINISSSVSQAAPLLSIGAIKADVDVVAHNAQLWEQISLQTAKVRQFSTETIKEIPQIQSTREIYKQLGKEPSRYRPSAEALMRRLIMGKEMYKISNVVDVINLASISTGYSIGGYDDNSVIGEVFFNRGQKDDVYDAIGRGIFNIEGLPVFYDELSAFGSPTSDSVRTMIKAKTKNILLLVMNFGGHQNFDNDLSLIEKYLREFCNSQNVEIYKV